tara:strand:- start:925 stop:1464 length:540 start_codon:yes stop_codon:yes gene_type:complete
MTMMIVAGLAVVGVVAYFMLSSSTGPPGPPGASQEQNPNGNIFKICGWNGTNCLTFDVNKPGGIQTDKCYRVDSVIEGAGGGRIHLKDTLQYGAQCGMSGIAAIPDGYSVMVNGLEGSWPPEKEACSAPRAKDIERIRKPNCPLTTGCLPNTGFGHRNSPGDWRRYCAFKLVKNSSLGS